MDKKVILITGTGSGLGQDVARKALLAGHTIYGGDLREEHMLQLEAMGGRGLLLDVTDTESVLQAVKTIIHQEGRIDVLVNAAGVGLFGNVENTPMKAARLIFEVNFWGYVQMIRAVLPQMRAQRRGVIVNIGSGSGSYATPMCGYYCASKFAVEAMSDSLRQEMMPFGIQVSLIEPGYFKSNIHTSILEGINSTPYDPDYEPLFRGFKDTFPEMWNNGADISVVSAAVLEAIEAELPDTRYYPTPGVPARIARKHSMSDRDFDAEMMREINWPE